MASRTLHTWLRFMPLAFSLVTTSCGDDSGDAPDDGDETEQDTEADGGDGSDAEQTEGDASDAEDTEAADNTDAGDPGEATDGTDADLTADGGPSGPELPAIDEVAAKQVEVAADLLGVSITEDGLIYVAGNTDDDGDAAILVGRFNGDGKLDTDFGENGYVVINSLLADDDHPDALVPGEETTNAIAALGDGGAAILITRNDDNLGKEVVLARLDASGELDRDFGEDGIASVPMTDWTFGEEWTDAGGETEPLSTAYDVLLDPSGDEERLVVFGASPAPMSTGRIDMDRYVVRIMADDGSLDTEFANDGIFSIDFGEKEGEDETRRGYVMDDGSIVSSGYTQFEETLHHVFLLQLDADGEPASDFGFADGASDCGTEQDGVICINPFIGEGYAEAYAVTVQADGRLVTTGYGEPVADSGTEQDLVSFRFDGEAMDTDYGTAGALIRDSGTEDRGRDIVSLDDGRLVHVGKYGGFAAMYVTDFDGELWSDFGEGGIASFPDFAGNVRGVAERQGLIAAVGDGGFFAVFRVEN